MRRTHQTPYNAGFRAGLIDQQYMIEDFGHNSQAYIQWFQGWKAGQASRAEQSPAPPKRKRPRRPDPQPVRRLHYLLRVDRLGKEPF